MMNYIWAGIMLFSLTVAAFNGRLEATVGAAMDGAKEAVMTGIGLLGVMCLWMGLMKIAERSGLINILSKLLRPLTKLLFPDVPQNSPAMRAILMNMSANILGVGNAATPLGLKAMAELDKRNGGRKVASNAMCMFVVINTASIQLIPATLLSLRVNYGSVAPFEIISAVWISSTLALIIGVSAAKLMEKRGNHA